jgi:hypothetical protein
LKWLGKRLNMNKYIEHKSKLTGQTSIKESQFSTIPYLLKLGELCCMLYHPALIRTM